MAIKRSQCRYGTMAYFDDDRWVGRAFATYGEYSEAEVDAFRMILKPGDRAVCVGANVGAFVIPMAQLVGPTGRVYAFEPRPDVFELLVENVSVNQLDNVECAPYALSDHDGTLKVKSQDWNQAYSYEVTKDADIEVPCLTLDTFFGNGEPNEIGAIKLIQMDVEGHEIAVLRGAEQTIAASRGFIYCEADRKDKAAELVSFLTEHRYRVWRHTAPMFNRANRLGQTYDVFGNCVSFNLLCAPEEARVRVTVLDEVADLRMDGQIFSREVTRYRRILEHDPDDLAARLLVGHFSNLQQHEDEAWEALNENLRRDPKHTGTLAIKALIEMQRGQYDWDAYELRYRQANTAMFGDRPHKGERWNGEPTEEPVLIWDEQGFGDSIMFGRYLPDAIGRAPNAFIEIQPQLYELFTHSFPHMQFYRRSRTLPDYTYHCSIPSLPSVLKIGQDVWRPTPYLRADPGIVAVWRSKEHPRVGLCCKGSAISERPFTRDITEALFEPVFPLEVPISLENKLGQFYNFAETAALIADLDLVITVDTSIAHLAGALAVPTWLLLSIDPDWRWGLKSDRTVWYDSVRIFRSDRVLDWTPVLERLKAELPAFYAAIGRRALTPRVASRPVQLYHTPLREAAE